MFVLLEECLYNLGPRASQEGLQRKHPGLKLYHTMLTPNIGEIV